MIGLGSVLIGNFAKVRAIISRSRCYFAKAGTLISQDGIILKGKDIT